MTQPMPAAAPLEASNAQRSLSNSLNQAKWLGIVSAAIPILLILLATAAGALNLSEFINSATVVAAGLGLATIAYWLGLAVTIILSVKINRIKREARVQGAELPIEARRAQGLTIFGYIFAAINLLPASFGLFFIGVNFVGLLAMPFQGF